MTLNTHTKAGKPHKPFRADATAAPKPLFAKDASPESPMDILHRLSAERLQALPALAPLPLPSAPKPCVMIVEDDPFIAIDMEDSFLAAGFTVMGPFARAEHAVAACARRTPDVATLDFNLMEDTSASVALALDLDSVPMVMVTASESEMRLSDGFADRECMRKPCDMDKLVARSRVLAAS